MYIEISFLTNAKRENEIKNKHTLEQIESN